MAPFQDASPLVFVDESMPFDTIRMAGELTTQFAVGPPFKEGPLGFDGVGGVAEVAVAVCIEESLFEVSEINVERVVADHVEHVNQGVVMELKQSDGQDERIEDADWKIETYRLRQCSTNQGNNCRLHLIKREIFCSML